MDGENGVFVWMCPQGLYFWEEAPDDEQVEYRESADKCGPYDQHRARRTIHHSETRYTAETGHDRHHSGEVKGSRKNCLNKGSAFRHGKRLEYRDNNAVDKYDRAYPGRE